jgi:predicted nuclease of predicted toxin-antitoxin system
MRFLVDASCDFCVVRALRGAGHDVRSVQEERPAATDRDIAAWAAAEDRILIAEDRDFGHLVHVSAVPVVGVLYLRFPAPARSTMPAQVCDAVARLGERLRGAFVVLQPGRVRVTRRVP